MDEKEYLLKVSLLEKKTSMISNLNEPLIHELIRGISALVANSRAATDYLLEQIEVSEDSQDMKSYHDAFRELNGALTKYHNSIYNLMGKRRKACYAEIEKIKNEFLGILKEQASSQQK